MGASTRIGGIGRGWLLAPLLVLFVAAAPAPSVVRLKVGSEVQAFKVPQDSPVRKAVWNDDNEGKGVRFPGRFKIAGRYSLTAGVSDLDDKHQFELIFIPDRLYARRLPSSVRDQHGVQDIIVTNSDEFIAKVVGQQLSQAVWTGQTKVIGGRVEMWVDDYGVGGSCENVEYYIHFLSIVKAEIPKFASAEEWSGCG